LSWYYLAQAGGNSAQCTLFCGLSESEQNLRIFAMAETVESSSGRDIHDSVIESLSVQYQMDEEHIRRIYEQELSKLIPGSRVKAFLPVLCSRHVKEILLAARS
jgi:hypothetical protein